MLFQTRFGCSLLFSVMKTVCLTTFFPTLSFFTKMFSSANSYSHIPALVLIHITFLIRVHLFSCLRICHKSCDSTFSLSPPTLACPSSFFLLSPSCKLVHSVKSITINYFIVLLHSWNEADPFQLQFFRIIPVFVFKTFYAFKCFIKRTLLQILQ